MKKRILLLAMPNTTYGFDRMCRMPNLGLSSIAGNIEKELIDEIAIVDLVTVRSDIRRYIVKLLKRFRPDIVGFSAMSFQYQTAIEICKLIKKINNDIITVIGGYHVTLDYESISESKDTNVIDFMIRREGEAAFNKLVKAIIEGNNTFSQIENLSYKKNRKFIHNPCSKNLDLSQIKIPNRSIRLTNKYYSFEKKADVIETSRGCSLKCNFCCVSSMYGRVFRKFSIERIIKDIKNVMANDTKIIFLVDDNVFINKKHLHEVCDAIIENNLNKIDYMIQASVHGIARDEDLVKKMAKAGFKFVFMGIENTFSNHLDFLAKDKNILNETERAVKLLQQNNIILTGGFIIGLPDDTRESIWQNYHFAKKLKIDNPVFSIMTPFHKTGVRDELKTQGLITNPDDFCFYDTVQSNVKTKHLSAEEIAYIFWEMYAKYPNLKYLKFSQIRKIYPYFFWKTVIKEFPKIIMQLYRKVFYSKPNFSNYKVSRKILIRDLKRCLLDRKETILSRLNESDIIQKYK